MTSRPLSPVRVYVEIVESNVGQERRMDYNVIVTDEENKLHLQYSSVDPSRLTRLLETVIFNRPKRVEVTTTELA